MSRLPWLLLLGCVWEGLGTASEAPESVIVTGKDLSRQLRDAQAKQRQESKSSEELGRFGAQTFADVAQNLPGVDSQTFCANCGAKRLTIDGLKGEHTTLLVDGLPLHSSVAGFYGMDAIPLLGLEEILVARGSGAAGLAPESIAGTLNLISYRVHAPEFRLRTEASDRQNSLLAFRGGTPYGTGSLTLSGQEAYRGVWDIDHNGVAEVPERKMRSIHPLWVHHWSDRLRSQLRVSYAELSNLGGSTTGYRPKTYTPIQAQPSDFLENNVESLFRGDPARITDHIQLQRSDLSWEWEYVSSDEASWKWAQSWTQQTLDAIYSHGFDYQQKDQSSYSRLSWEKASEDGRHLWTLQLDQKRERLDSSSEALYLKRTPPLKEDDLHFESQALGLSDHISWQDLSLSLGLRIDKLTIAWDKLDYSFSKTIMAPRANLRWAHSEHISTLLSWGVGYRSPLTLFESEHGADHSGFRLALDRLEESRSSVASLSFNYPSWFATFSTHLTELKGVAYADDRVVKGEPIVFRNDTDVHRIWAHDLYTGFKQEALDVQIGWEMFEYEDSYAQKLPAAAVERRLKLDVLWQKPVWDIAWQAVWTAERKLGRYGYDQHFRVYDLDVTSDTFGQVSQQKNQNAPAFWLAHLRAAYRPRPKIQVDVRVNNIFDFTQTGYGDSPATWHWHINHAHYDNFHTWGPLTGREWTVGLDLTL